uniref:Uncharacterized protein n=1 Tax=Setaria digitata TaxID=48799 RepID=A0A915Q4D7_9BILA
MFLIAKIVRGRRLLQELEAEAEKKATERAVVAETTATTLRRSGMGSRTVEVGQSEAGPSNATSTHTTSMSPTCRSVLHFSSLLLSDTSRIP